MFINDESKIGRIRKVTRRPPPHTHTHPPTVNTLPQETIIPKNITINRNIQTKSESKRIGKKKKKNDLKRQEKTQNKS